MALAFAQGFGFLADLVMVVLDFWDMFILKACLHPFIYALKLKIEFLVLNRLGEVVSTRGDDLVEWVGETEREGGNGVDVAWPSKGGFKEVNASVCLSCEVLRKGESLGTDSSFVINEDSLSPLTLGSSKNSLGSLDSQVAVVYEDEGLQDLERQYLGPYK